MGLFVVSQWSPCIAASPARKVNNTERNPPFGLREIKCPTVNDITEVKCLKKNEEGNYFSVTVIITIRLLPNLQYVDSNGVTFTFGGK